MEAGSVFWLAKTQIALSSLKLLKLTSYGLRLFSSVPAR